jgi:hypothetical protein
MTLDAPAAAGGYVARAGGWVVQGYYKSTGADPLVVRPWVICATQGK